MRDQCRSTNAVSALFSLHQAPRLLRARFYNARFCSAALRLATRLLRARFCNARFCIARFCIGGANSPSGVNLPLINNVLAFKDVVVGMLSRCQA